MSPFWIKTLQLLLCFALLIILHEGGHFFFAKLFGIRVEKFFMFFDYKFHLFSTKDKWFKRLFPKISQNETEYGIGWIPLGGYVKISGMIDESMDLEQMKQPVQPWEFRSKSVWQRFLVMVGGVLVNFLLALFIYAMILFAWGRDSLPIRSIDHGFSYNEMAEAVGFRDGDIPVAADGLPIETWDATVYRIISEAKTITVLRDGGEVLLTMPSEGLNLLDMLDTDPRFLSVNVPARVDSVLPESPAALVGMKKGARILEIDGKPVDWWSDFDAIMGRKADILAVGCSHEDSLRLRSLPIVFSNEEGTTPDTVVIQLDENYMLGIVKQPYQLFYKEAYVHHDYGFFASIPAGITYGWETLKGYVSDLKYVFSKKGAQSVGSFGTIGNLFPAVWDWASFWNITAFISLMLAFMNILPIPGLDGGHIFFLLVEAVTRRPPSEKFMERAQYVGMILILALMALAIFNDVVKFLF
ncbi:MAG: RIP metalloprotease RseP [Bacteroidaceae bacterium]|nr:RIP metalloprotease RseP [Bacteroidaceae bacterium]